MKTLSMDERMKITPDKALEILLKGNERFMNSLSTNRDHLSILSEFSKEQKPFAFILSCIDSRSPVEIIFDQGIGDLFSARVAGNVVNEDIIGSAEFAVKIIGVKLLLVLGHTNCGAMKACLDNITDGHLKHLVEKIKPVYLSHQQEIDQAHNPKDKLAEYNVISVIHQMVEKSNIIRQYLNDKRIKIAGAMFDIDTGKVSIIQE